MLVTAGAETAAGVAQGLPLIELLAGLVVTLGCTVDCDAGDAKNIDGFDRVGAAEVACCDG